MSEQKGVPPRAPEDHALGRSRGGYTSKLHLVTDGKGVPLGAFVSAGQSITSRSTSRRRSMRRSRLGGVVEATLSLSDWLQTKAIAFPGYGVGSKTIAFRR